MLTKLYLRNFKCFENLALPIGSLTLLTGLNAAGKSTVLQSLGILNQTIRENEWGTAMLLNGPCVNLGTAGDVINHLKGRNSFGVGVETERIKCLWNAAVENRSELVAQVTEITLNDEPHSTSGIPSGPTGSGLRRLLPLDVTDVDVIEPAEALVERLRDLTYISAERIGPREVYEAFSEGEERTVGVQGERTAYFLYKHETTIVHEALRVHDEQPNLPRQTGAWLAKFFPGAEYKVEPVTGANLVILSMRAHHSTNFHRPQNVGYGLTHILPILAACLGTSHGRVLMIDNPEAHLHPSGQALMGEFLAKVAAAGVQLIIETHSDHVLNGIRRAVKSHVVEPEACFIHFFTIAQSDEDVKPRVISPAINRSGYIDHWPPGFFDQLDKDMKLLVDWQDG